MSHVHTPFDQVARDHGIDLLEAILMTWSNGGQISYNGMIGSIEPEPEEGDLFAFRCPSTGFEDFVPADSLCAVTVQSEGVCS